MTNVSLSDDATRNADLHLHTIYPPPETLGFKIPKIVLYCSILLICTTGNAMLIAVILSSKRMRSLPSNILILNLAFVDLLTLIMSIPFDVVVEENHYIWPYGDALCKLLFPAATLLSTCSSLTLAAISLDRYRTLLHPFKSKLSVIQVKCILVAVDCVSVLFVVPYAVFLGLQNNICIEEWPGFLYRQIYTVFLVSVQYALPLLFMTTMYILASSKLYTATKNVRKMSISLENDRRPSTSFRERLVRRESFAVSQEQNVKVTKMFVIIVVAFAICTLPNQVLWLWIDFGKNGDVTSLTKEIIICRFFTYTNGCLNPIIFFTFRRDYRRGLHKILRRMTGRRPETNLERIQRLWSKFDVTPQVGGDTKLARQRKMGIQESGPLVDQNNPKFSIETCSKSTLQSQLQSQLHKRESCQAEQALKARHVISTTSARKVSQDESIATSWV